MPLYQLPGALKGESQTRFETFDGEDWLRMLLEQQKSARSTSVPDEAFRFDESAHPQISRPRKPCSQVSTIYPSRRRHRRKRRSPLGYLRDGKNYIGNKQSVKVDTAGSTSGRLTWLDLSHQSYSKTEIIRSYFSQ